MRSKFYDYLGPEDHLHMQVVNYVRFQYAGARILHAPNEGRRTLFERFKIKLLGVNPGFPDLLIIWQTKIVAVELKFGNNKPTTHQSGWIDFLNANNIPAAVKSDFDSAKDFIDTHLKQAA
jgi:hypothetical protein